MPELNDLRVTKATAAANIRAVYGATRATNRQHARTATASAAIGNAPATVRAERGVHGADRHVERDIERDAILAQQYVLCAMRAVTS